MLFRSGSILHDIGKIAIPDRVLLKPGPLSAEEWVLMKQHTVIGATLCSELKSLRAAVPIIRHHHERWDGNGYPKGLKGEDIPWPGRVMAAVDTFEALTVTRFHQEPLPIDGAMSLIERASGTQFDPAIVAALKQVLPDMRAIRDTYADQLGDLVDLDFASPTAPDKRSLVPPNPAAKRDPEGVARLQKATADEERALRLARQRNQAELEASARALAKQHGAKVSSVIGDNLLKQNFPLIHAVGRAADQSRAPRWIELRRLSRPT